MVDAKARKIVMENEEIDRERNDTRQRERESEREWLSGRMEWLRW